MIRKDFLIKGKVQGVGFRFFCKYEATLLSLSGFAENLENGDVHIEVQGEETSVRKFKDKILKGNGFSKIIDIEERTLPLKSKEKRFSAY